MLPLLASAVPPDHGVLASLAEALLPLVQGVHFPRLIGFPVAVAAGANAVLAGLGCATDQAAAPLLSAEAGAACEGLSTFASLSMVYGHATLNTTSPAAALVRAVLHASATHVVRLLKGKQEPLAVSAVTKGNKGLGGSAAASAAPASTAGAGMSPAPLPKLTDRELERLLATTEPPEVLHRHPLQDLSDLGAGERARVVAHFLATKHRRVVDSPASAADSSSTEGPPRGAYDNVQSTVELRRLLDPDEAAESHQAQGWRIAMHHAFLFSAMSTAIRLLHKLCLLQCRPALDLQRPPTLPDFLRRQLRALETAPSGGSVGGRADGSAASRARARNSTWFVSSVGEGSLIGSYEHPLLVPAQVTGVTSPAHAGAFDGHPATVSLETRFADAAAAGAGRRPSAVESSTRPPGPRTLFWAFSRAAAASCHPYPIPCSDWRVMAGAPGAASEHPAARILRALQDRCMPSARESQQSPLKPYKEQYRQALEGWARMLEAWQGQPRSSEY
jgi:hypothetical protein